MLSLCKRYSKRLRLWSSFFFKHCLHLNICGYGELTVRRDVLCTCRQALQLPTCLRCCHCCELGAFGNGIQFIFFNALKRQLTFAFCNRCYNERLNKFKLYLYLNICGYGKLLRSCNVLIISSKSLKLPTSIWRYNNGKLCIDRYCFQLFLSIILDRNCTVIALCKRYSERLKFKHCLHFNICGYSKLAVRRDVLRTCHQALQLPTCIGLRHNGQHSTLGYAL